MADPSPQKKDGAVEKKKFEDKKDVAEDDSIEDLEDSSGEEEKMEESSDGEEDESYVVEDDSNGMLTSSEDGKSYEEEKLDTEVEIHELQGKIIEEERRARGGWTDETAEVYRRELKQEWVLCNSQVQPLQQPVVSAAGGVWVLQQITTAAERSAGRVSQQQPCLASPKIEVAAGVGSPRVSKDVLNLPRLASECSLQANMAGTVFVAANMVGEENSAAADIGCDGVLEGALNLPTMASGYIQHTDIAGADIVVDQLGIADPYETPDSMQAADVFPARPVSAFSAEEAALMDLYAAQPLQAHPDPMHSALMTRPVAAQNPILTQSQPNSSIAASTVGRKTQPVCSRLAKILSPDLGRKPTAAASKTHKELEALLIPTHVQSITAASPLAKKIPTFPPPSPSLTHPKKPISRLKNQPFSPRPFQAQTHNCHRPKRLLPLLMLLRKRLPLHFLVVALTLCNSTLTAQLQVRPWVEI